MAAILALIEAFPKTSSSKHLQYWLLDRVHYFALYYSSTNHANTLSDPRATLQSSKCSFYSISAVGVSRTGLLQSLVTVFLGSPSCNVRCDQRSLQRVSRHTFLQSGASRVRIIRRACSSNRFDLVYKGGNFWKN